MGLVVVQSLALFATSSAWAGSPASHGPSDPTTSAVRLGDAAVFVLPGAEKGDAARARSAAQVLDAAAHRGETKVTARREGDTVRILVGNHLVVELNQLDASRAGHQDPAVYAQGISRQVSAALLKEKKRRTMASRVLSASSVVFLGLVAWLAIRFAGRLAQRTIRRIERDRTAVGAVQLHQVELLPAAAARDAVRLLIHAVLWLVRFGLFYFWVLAALSLFEATRPWASRATEFLFAPVLALLGQVLERLPLLLSLVLTFAVVLLLVRFVSLYCAAIERGEIESEWIRPETARTSGTLLVIAVSLAALLLVPPLLAGNADGSLPRIGLLLMGTLALGATPFLSSCLLGIRAVYENTWRVGDRIEYGGQSGRVVRLALYDVTLKTDEGSLVKVPHLMSLWHPTRIFPIESSVLLAGQGTRDDQHDAD